MGLEHVEAAADSAGADGIDGIERRDDSDVDNVDADAPGAVQLVSGKCVLKHLRKGRRIICAG
jgi:hypothetical protein